MKKLLKNIFICFLMMTITMAIIWLLPGTYPHDLSVLVNKREMIKSKKSPKIVFMGASSQLSFKSPQIEMELNYSVANMGLWGGLSTKRYLEEIKPYLNPGDVVVITQEYSAALDKKYVAYIKMNFVSKKFFFLMSPAKHATVYCKKREYFSMLKIIFELCQIKTTSYIRNLVTLNFSQLFNRGFPNYRKEFNKNGDRNRPFSTIRPLADSGIIFSKPDMKNHIFLNNFYDFALRKKVRVFFYFSHFPEEEYKLNKKYIDMYYTMMKKQLKFPIINKPSDFMFPRDYFADTIYHLNEKGEKVRTKKIIEQLKKVL